MISRPPRLAAAFAVCAALACMNAGAQQEPRPAAGLSTKTWTPDNGNGTWTYNYAVMNLDYARAVVQSAPASGGPDPRVVSNKGFDSFSIPLPAGATVAATQFRNGTLDSASQWGVNVGSDSVTWSTHARTGVPVPVAPKRPTLDWGTLYSFSITVNKAPGSGSSSLHVATSGTPSAYSVATLVPSG